MQYNSFKTSAAAQSKSEALAPLCGVIIWPENVPKNGKEHESYINGDCNPEHDLVSQWFLKVIKNNQAHAQSSNGSGYMGNERDLGTRGRRFKSSVDGVTKIATH